VYTTQFIYIYIYICRINWHSTVTVLSIGIFRYQTFFAAHLIDFAAHRLRTTGLTFPAGPPKRLFRAPSLFHSFLCARWKFFGITVLVLVFNCFFVSHVRRPFRFRRHVQRLCDSIFYWTFDNEIEIRVVFCDHRIYDVFHSRFPEHTSTRAHTRKFTQVHKIPRNTFSANFNR
jgi:hypothetical protein